jgi:uncharacterized membrane protein YbhN (UPF0104 family)
MSSSDTAKPATGEPPRALARTRRGQSWSRVATAISIALFGVAIAVLWNTLSGIDLYAVRDALGLVPSQSIALALAFTLMSYLLLTGYDALALRQLRVDIPYYTTALASFASYAISFTLGFPLVTAGTVRYWIYAPKGLSAAKVASLTLIAGVTFWLGMGLVIGCGLLIAPDRIGVLGRLPFGIAPLIGTGVIAAIAFYLWWVSTKRRAVRIQRWLIRLPTLSVSLGQLVLGALDVIAASSVLYVLLPAGHGIDVPSFAAIYALACLLGILSHAPGGLGVFEATMLLAFPQVSREGMLGALLLFRLSYYLLPFLVALVILGLYEITRRITGYRQTATDDDEAEADS